MKRIVHCLKVRTGKYWWVFVYMLGNLSTSAQTSATDSINAYVVSNYVDYYNTEREWIHAHLNKNIFFPGETIWFKNYILDAVGRRPFLGTKNLYAEILDEKGKQLEKKILFVDKGTAFGNFRLPDSIQPGRYLFRAYTLWSRNFGAANYFVRSFSVAGKQQQVKTSSDEVMQYAISFYPESGVFLSGMDNTIAFKITDNKGFGIQTNGLIRLNGKEVKKISNNTPGMGSFNLFVNPGDKFIAEFSFPDGQIREVPLPEPLDKGVKLAVNNEQKDSLVVTVRTNYETLKNLSDEKFYLLVHRQGVVSHLYWMSFVNRWQYVTLYFPKSLIPAGVSHVTLFDSKYKPVADRAFFLRKAEQEIDLALSTSIVKDSMVVSVTANDHSGRPVQANMSVSVLPEGTVADQSGTTILSRYFLESDLKGFIESPQYYFEKDRTTEETDRLMMVQGWRTYDWNAILNHKKQELPFRFEQGFFVNGSVDRFMELKDRTNKHIVLYSPENDLMLQSPIDSTGRFEFSYLSLFDSSTVYLNIPGKERKKLGEIKAAVSTAGFDPGFTKADVMPAPIVEVSVPGEEGIRGKLMEEVRIKTKVKDNNVFAGDMGVSIMDKVYIIDRDALMKYRTLIDLLQQKFFLRVRREDSLMLLHIDMGSGTASFQLNSDPTLIIDGIASPLNTIDNLNLSDIKAIAVNKTGNAGIAFGGAGSIVIKTRKGGDEILEDNLQKESLKKILVKGYDMPSSWFMPVYGISVTDPRYIQYGSVFWIPNLHTDSSGKASFKFYLPKGMSGLKLHTEGISNTGKILFDERKIRW